MLKEQLMLVASDRCCWRRERAVKVVGAFFVIDTVKILFPCIILMLSFASPPPHFFVLLFSPFFYFYP